MQLLAGRRPARSWTDIGSAGPSTPRLSNPNIPPPENREMSISEVEAHLCTRCLERIRREEQARLSWEESCERAAEREVRSWKLDDR
jgi:hypothetical protein